MNRPPVTWLLDMNFLFIDRIIELEPGKRAVGIKHVTSADTYLGVARDGKRSVLLTSIVGEALGQLGAWAAMRAHDFKLRPVAGRVGKVCILDEVFVGDTLLLETVIDSLSEDRVFYHGTARVNDTVVYTIEDALGPVLPMNDFIDEAVVRQQFDMIYRPDEKPIAYASQKSLGTENITAFSGVDFDHILEWDEEGRVVAQKNVSFNAPYFADHFPRKPVLPLTLFLQAKLRLACLFLRNTLGESEASQFRFSSVSNVKMTRFVQPGATVVTTMTVAEQSADRVRFKYSSHLGNKKRICVATAEFVRERR